MTWVEFIEALARAADITCAATPIIDPIVFSKPKQFKIIGFLGTDNSHQPVALKIQNIIPLLMNICSQSVKANFVWNRDTMPFFQYDHPNFIQKQQHTTTLPQPQEDSGKPKELKAKPNRKLKNLLSPNKQSKLWGLDIEVTLENQEAPEIQNDIANSDVKQRLKMKGGKLDLKVKNQETHIESEPDSD